MAKPAQRPRLISALGKPQIRRIGYHRHVLSDVYHWFLTISWPRLFLVVFAAFFALNSLFALAYLADGSAIENARPGSFWDAFFFSVQTLATLGYGKMAPANFYANIISSIEVFAGLLSLALVTGMVFSKFSRPTVRILFSRVAVVSLHEGQPSLMFRMANARTNQVLEADLNFSLLRNETTAEGGSMRRFHHLRLLRHHTPVFALSWLAIHPIDEASPLYGQTRESLEASESELVVSFSGVDDILMQPVHKQHSYLPGEIVWNAAFQDVLLTLPSGELVVHYEKFHDFVPLE